MAAPITAKIGPAPGKAPADTIGPKLPIVPVVEEVVVEEVYISPQTQAEMDLGRANVKRAQQQYAMAQAAVIDADPEPE